MKKELKFMYRFQSGITLIELLVSMLIGLFIMAGVLQMFSTASQNSVAVAGASRIQENIRYAFSRIAKDVSQSGNLGCLGASVVSRYSKNGNNLFKNNLGVSGLTNIENSLYDFLKIAHGTSSAVDNLGGAAAANTDIFRIRYMSHAFKIPVTAVDASTASTKITLDISDSNFAPLAPPSPASVAGEIVGVSNCSNGSVFMLTGNATSGGEISVVAGAANAVDGIYNVSADLEISEADATATQYYLYGGTSGAYEYFIGNAAGGDCAVGQEQCALYRRNGGPTASAQELVQGVHDMDVMYGSTDATTGNLTFATAAQVTTANNWANIDRLKVTLAFNSIENAQTQGNNVNQLLTKTVSQTFNLYNQL